MQLESSDVAVRLPLLVGWFCSLLALAPAQGLAQVLQSFEDIALRVNLGDRIEAEDHTGNRIAGQVIGLRRGEIAVQTGAGEVRLARDTTRQIAVRGHSLARGALIGTAVFAVLGAVAVCYHEGGATCAIVGPLGAAPVGAGIGLAAGAVIPTATTVYRAPGRGLPSQTGPSGGDGQASLLEDLGLRVNVGDRIRIQDRAGTIVVGRLIGLATQEMAVHTATGLRRFARQDISQIALRRRPVRMAVLIGATAGVVAGVLAACTGPERSECADAPILSGGLGAGLGLAAGALVQTTTIVFPEPETRISVVPIVARGGAGVRLKLAW